ncbi:hypothetical protein [Rhizobium sp. 2MFCol3.1]|uniref:hypothetical protein n=1 Tax=Rhizobium sp. 2MFCol3.1 TaxID=1246459 RepID=UPI000374B166|nr:hypothetical protein [Rhizobium sp. 2MFCol3.1]
MTSLDIERNYLTTLQVRAVEAKLKLETARKGLHDGDHARIAAYNKALFCHHDSVRELRRVERKIAELEREAEKPSVIERLFGGG